MEATESERKRRSFRGVSPEQRQAERRQKLVDAASQLYGTRGFYGVTVREICAEAHLTERYFYESFASSDALFAAVYQHLVAQLQQAIMLALPGEMQPKAVAYRGLDAFLAFIEQNPQAARILFVEVPRVRFEQDNHVIRKTIVGFDHMIANLALMMFPKAKDSGLSLELIAAGLNGSNIHIVSRWVLGEFKESRAEILEHCFAIFAGAADYVEQRARQARLKAAAVDDGNKPIPAAQVPQ